MLRRVLETCVSQHFGVAEVSIAGDAHGQLVGSPALVADQPRCGRFADGEGGGRPSPGDACVVLVLHGRGSVAGLAGRLQEVRAVRAVHSGVADPDG